MAEIRHLENRHDVIFSADLDTISVTGAEWYVDCGDVVEIETRCRILIRRTFGRIQCHVIPEPHITLQGAATWWIHCHDSRATCNIAGWSHLAKSMSLQGVRIPSAILKIVFRHILFIFLFLMQFRLWRAVAFVSSPIYLLWAPAQRKRATMLYFANVFIYLFFLLPPYSPALVNGGSRKFYTWTWWTLSVIREVTTRIFSWSSLNYRVGQKVTKFGIFSDPARKLSALTPERGRIL